MSRRTFDHLYAELCVAAGRRLSRYDLWMAVWDSGGDPEALNADGLHAFFAEGLDALLREEGASLDATIRRRLERDLLRFDPSHPTPEEWLMASTGRGAA